MHSRSRLNLLRISSLAAQVMSNRTVMLHDEIITQADPSLTIAGRDAWQHHDV